MMAIEADLRMANSGLQDRVEQLRHDLARTHCEVGHLKAAIREHRDQRGDDRCHLDDQKLYAVLGEGDADPYAHDATLPPKGEFLRSCERYWHQRQPKSGTDAIVSGCMTIAQLEADIASLSRNLRETANSYDFARGEIDRLKAELAETKKGSP